MESWVIVNRTTRRVVGTLSVEPPAGAYDPEQFEVVYYTGPVTLADPDEGIEATILPEGAAEDWQDGDIYSRISRGDLVRAFALVTLDEINILRTEHGFSERTAEQLRAAIKAKLKQ